MRETEERRLVHTFEPVFDDRSRILILGTFPSVKSREVSFYYGHPQNRFWKVLAALTGQTVPEGVEGRREFLLRNRIAVWDVIASCRITGSSDSSIRDVVPNDLSLVLAHAPVEAIYANGAKAFSLYERYCLAGTGRKIVKLPSTSPANASCSLDRLIGEWRRILQGRQA